MGLGAEVGARARVVSPCGSPASDAPRSTPSAEVTRVPRFGLTPVRRDGHVWFNSPFNTAVEITPYSRVYGLHPRFFDFDASGSMQLTPMAERAPSASPVRSPHSQSPMADVLGSCSAPEPPLQFGSLSNSGSALDTPVRGCNVSSGSIRIAPGVGKGAGAAQERQYGGGYPSSDMVSSSCYHRPLATPMRMASAPCTHVTGCFAASNCQFDGVGGCIDNVRQGPEQRGLCSGPQVCVAGRPAILSSTPRVVTTTAGTVAQSVAPRKVLVRSAGSSSRELIGAAVSATAALPVSPILHDAPVAGKVGPSQHGDSLVVTMSQCGTPLAKRRDALSEYCVAREAACAAPRQTQSSFGGA